MNSKGLVAFIRWMVSGLGLLAIVVLYARFVHVNSTTVALSFLLFIFYLATKCGLRYAVVTSLAATAAYNYFFLPPVHTFTVSDPQNLVALFVFLITSLVSSRMSGRIRQESCDVLAKQSELEVLYSLSRGLLQTDELSVLTNTVPLTVSNACSASAVIFFLLQGDKVYRHGAEWPTQLSTTDLRALAQMSAVSFSAENGESIVPLRTGVKPCGVLLLRGARLSMPTLEAIGGLVSVSLDKARAVEEVTRAEAGKESERLRSMMMDSITREIRSPLAAINASVALLRSKSAEEFSQTFAVIDLEMEHLNKLVAQSVEMAQLDTLAISMDLKPESLEDMIRAAVHASGNFLKEHPVHVVLPPKLGMVQADPAWIQTLVENLLENAGKYSAPGQPVYITAEISGEMVACSVADRGMGIDPLEQALIFDKFYRSHAGTPTTGSGMGLSICRAIAEAHGGGISVTSQPGQGSVFTFTLPLSVNAERMSR